MRWIVLLAGIVVGFTLLGYDQRTDDTGVEAALLIASAMALAFAAPRVWIAVALAVGLPIALSSALHGNAPGIAAVFMTGAGALLGAALRGGAARRTPARV